MPDTTPVFPGLDAGFASACARVALANVTRAWPHKLDHVMHADDDVASPRLLHPAFFGSFDWHSAVHMHWLLLRVLRRHPDLPEAGAIVDRLDAHLHPDTISVERAYLDRPGTRSFERPYGWAWLLALQAEAASGARETGPHAAAFTRWHEAVAPLADAFATRMEDFLPRAAYPMRVGTHPNTAFALRLSLHSARVEGRAALADVCRERALAWHADDRNCPVDWEPSLDEFLSPGLMIAALMTDVLDADALRRWLDRFLPDRSPRALARWLAPPVVGDRGDPKMAHLDGLSLSRAWCMRRLLATGACDDALAALFTESVDAHLRAALPQVEGGDYMGEHWLASFAALAMDDL